MDRAALSPLLRSFERHLRAENRSERTIASYMQSARQAESFLASRGISLTGAGRADLEAFLGDLLGRRTAATAATRYKVLRILYRWLEEEDEVAVNPMARMRPPIVPEQPVPVVPEDGLRRLLATCAGKSFEDRRDTALILLLVDVGPRRAELMGLKAGWLWTAAILGFAGTVAARLATTGAGGSPGESPASAPRWRHVAHYGNEAVLPFYVLHEPVIVAVAWVVVRWSAPLPVKYLSVVAASFILTLALYEGLVRRFQLTRFLFGMKPARPTGPIAHQTTPISAAAAASPTQEPNPGWAGPITPPGGTRA